MEQESDSQVQPACPIVPEATQHTMSLLEAQLGASHANCFLKAEPLLSTLKSSLPMKLKK